MDEPDRKRRSDTRLVVVGQGYVGLPLAIRAAEVGYDVVGLETDKDRVSALVNGESYVDDVPDRRLASALAAGNYVPKSEATSLDGFDIAVITVPTPLSEGIPDTSYIEEASRMAACYLSQDATVILESTTYPGTTEELVVPILEHVSGLVCGRDFHVGYSPERIDPGNREWSLERTPKLVSGVGVHATNLVDRFYRDLVDETFVMSGTREAELAKLLENTFRHVNIALVNEIAIHCRSLGIDVWNVVEGARTKPFGFMSFTPGPGVGGHCLPVDPSYMSWQFERKLGSVSRFVKIANDVNESMPAHVVQRIQAGLNSALKPVNGSSVLVVGLAYKPDSNDTRESPAVAIIDLLVGLGADLSVYDPHVGDHKVDDYVRRVTDLTIEAVVSADAVVVVTDHSDMDRELLVDHGRYVFDCRNCLRASSNVERL